MNIFLKDIDNEKLATWDNLIDEHGPPTGEGHGQFKFFCAICKKMSTDDISALC